MPPSPVSVCLPKRQLSACPLPLLRLLLILAVCLRAGVLSAGGSAETTLIVVNAESPLSLQVANLYAELRDIPATHILHLKDIPVLASIDTHTFFTRIWQPLTHWLQQHDLQNEIDTIAYSAGFPYDVDFRKDLKAAGQEKQNIVGTVASLTGMTYYAPLAARKQLVFLSDNLYYRRQITRQHCEAKKVHIEKADIQKYRQGENFLHDKQPRKALEIFSQLAKDYPTQGDILWQLARARAGAGQPGPAMEALQLAARYCRSDSTAMQVDRYLKQLHKQPGYRKLVKIIGYTDGVFQPAHGFRSRYLWSGADTPLAVKRPANAGHYILSTLLAYTGPRGNSLAEIDRYLRAAAGSDGTQPDGSVYLLANENVRSVTRQSTFSATAEALRNRGRKVRILTPQMPGQDGVLPKGVNDIIGAVLGSKTLKWSRADSKIMPGGIVEALTSYGGAFRNNSQTKLTENLRQGAAGSSGAVVEPFAIQAKFPAPYLHVHYADGSSLAEAFYQSIRAPYQLIVVGDPLARPFARLVPVEIAAPATNVAWQGTVEIKPRIRQPGKHLPVRVVELWIDGQHVGDGLPDSHIVWDTTSVEDGAHELRLVAVEDSAIETRSSSSFAITVANGIHAISVDPVAAAVPLGDIIRLSGTAEGADRIEVLRGFEVLARSTARAGRWSAAVPADKTGMGNSKVFVRAYFPDGSTVRSRPVPVQVTPPARLPATGNAPDSQHGLWLEVEYQDGSRIKRSIDGMDRRGLRGLVGHKPPITRLYIRGEFRVLQNGFNELVFNTAGKLLVRVDGQVVIDTSVPRKDSDAIAGLGLDAGWHRLEVVLHPEGEMYLEGLLTGDDAGVMLSHKRVRHTATSQD